MTKEAEPSSAAAEHHEAAFALASQRRFADAVKEYLQAVRLSPSLPHTFYNLGVAYGELGQWKKAIRNYQKAIRLNPADPQAYRNLGVDYVNIRRYAKAATAFRCAAKLSPDDMTLFVSIGYNCGRLRRYSEAIDAYSRAVQLNLISPPAGTTLVFSIFTNISTLTPSLRLIKHLRSTPNMTSLLSSSGWCAENPETSMVLLRC